MVRVARKGTEVDRGIAEFEKGFANDIGGGLGAEHPNVNSGGTTGSVRAVPRQMIGVDLLPRHIIEDGLRFAITSEAACA